MQNWNHLGWEHMYENGIVKPIKIVLQERKGIKKSDRVG
jgi:hypothetical protein